MSQNDITGDEITSKAASDEYRTNYDRIFRQQTPAQASGIAPEQTPIQAPGTPSGIASTASTDITDTTDSTASTDITDTTDSTASTDTTDITDTTASTDTTDITDTTDSTDSTPPNYKEIVKIYKKIGCANSTGFHEPDGSGPWRRCHQSVSGCYEVYCDDKLQIYYDCFCD